MEAAGARVLVAYGSTETQALAFSCASPRSADDLHFLDHRFALVQRRRELPNGGPTVHALAFTPLSRLAAKIAVNAELGGVGTVEKYSCDCALGRLGLRTHLSSVVSFEKMSTAGTSFAHSTLQTVLVTVLPSCFGGTSLDYQLVEERRNGGAAQLILRISPSVGRLNESAVRRAFLTELGQGGIVDQHHAQILERAGSITVARQAPLVTERGKMRPFHVLDLTKS